MYVLRATFQLPNNGLLYLLLSHEVKAQPREQVVPWVTACCRSVPSERWDLPSPSGFARSSAHVPWEKLCICGPAFGKFTHVKE